VLGFLPEGHGLGTSGGTMAALTGNRDLRAVAVWQPPARVLTARGGASMGQQSA
jgi:hypothetical protein